VGQAFEYDVIYEKSRPKTAFIVKFLIKITIKIAIQFAIQFAILARKNRGAALCAAAN
jgi:hypothetical protein